MESQTVIGFLISLTAAACYINYKYIKLQKSIGVILVTLIFTLTIFLLGKLWWRISNFAEHFLRGVNFNESFLHGMLGFLLFAGALHINSIELRQHRWMVALLATLSVIISSFVIAVVTYYLTSFLNIDLPFSFCFVFGTLISPTDPIAVLSILKTVKVPKTFRLKITGEALFNDATAVVLFFVATSFAYNDINRNVDMREVVYFFVYQGIGGLFLGILIGLLSSVLLKNINDYEVAILITLSIVSGGSSISELLGTSSPIVIVVAGLVVGNSMKKDVITDRIKDRLHEFWQLLDAVLNAVLFVLIGVEFIGISLNISTFIASFLIIFVTIISRWISISIPVAFFSQFRKINSSLILMMTIGGLRGGISIALALSVSDELYHDLIVAITYIVVLFSMIVQGLLFGPLLKRMFEN